MGRILGVIPARGGSKGIPGKNIKNLGGKPLLEYSVRAAIESKMLSEVILSTDDVEIAEVGKKLGIQVPFIRPKELAQDKTPTLPVLQHALDFMEKSKRKFDAVCLLQVTSPFRNPDLIDRAIAKFEDSGADSLVTVLKVPDHYNPHWTFEEDLSGLLRICTGEKQIIPRRQDLPKVYHRDGSIYLVKRDILKNGSLYGDKIAFLENDPEDHVNIDTQEDWGKAEEIIKKKY